MADIDSEKDSLGGNIEDVIASKLKEGVTDELVKKLKSELEGRAQFQYSFYTFILCFLVISSILVFVGYKLYKAQKERQRKAEEKQRLKQMKKKK